MSHLRRDAPAMWTAACIHRFLFAVLAVGALAFPAAAQPADGAPALLSPATPPPLAERHAPEQGHAARARHVRLHPGALAGDAGRPSSTVTLDLFDGHRVVLVADHVARPAPGRLTWRGHVAGRPSERASVSVVGAAASGRFVVDGRVYLLAYAGAGRHVLYEYARPEETAACHTLAPEEGPEEPPERGGAGWAPPPAESAGVPAARSGEPLDLMILYTPAVAAAVGPDGLAPLFDAYLDTLNESFATAGTPHAARLVLAREIAYDEDPDRSLFTDLRHLSGHSDGELDAAHAWRDEVHADAVVLVVEEGANYCGVAYIMAAFERRYARWAFAVVKRPCAHGDLIFAHEVGHFLGIRHDRYVDQSETPAPDAHGFVNVAPKAGGPFRTVLAYENRCWGAGFSCPTVPSFSSSSATLGGEALGEAGRADAARVLGKSVPVAASFRDPSDLPPGPVSIKVETDEDEELSFPLRSLVSQLLGEPVTLFGVGDPTVGTLEPIGGNVTYRPPPNFNGTVTFDCAFRDEVGLLGTGTVEIVVHPVNDRPSTVYITEPQWAASLTVDAASEETFTVAWEEGTDADGDALTYTWQLAGGVAQFASPLLEIEAGSRRSVEVPLAALARVMDELYGPDVTDHTFYHRALTSDGELQQGGASQTLVLTRSAVALDPTLAFALRGPFPNPTRGEVHLLLDLPEDAAIDLTLYDVLGREVAAAHATAEAGAGRHVTLDVGALAAGRYLYRLRVAQGGEEVHEAGRLSVLD